jgi:hypothetical protein
MVNKMIGTILEEPRGAVYVTLLDYMAVKAGSFSLVWRDDFSPSEDAEVLRMALSPFLVSEEHTDRWPGTQILGSLAWVRYYRIEPESIMLLKSAPALYARLSDFGRPEDLAFYDKAGGLILGSIAHEHDSWVEVKFATKLSSGVPGVRIA